MHYVVTQWVDEALLAKGQEDRSKLVKPHTLDTNDPSNLTRGGHADLVEAE